MKTVKNYSELTLNQKNLFIDLADRHNREWNEHCPYDDFIMVMTPNPYVIYKWCKGDDLDKFVEDFYKVLTYLGINRKEAIKNDYTLNSSTGEKLRMISWDKKPLQNKDFILSFIEKM